MCSKYASNECPAIVDHVQESNAWHFHLIWLHKPFGNAVEHVLKLSQSLSGQFNVLCLLRAINWARKLAINLKMRFAFVPLFYPLQLRIGSAWTFELINLFSLPLLSVPFLCFISFWLFFDVFFVNKWMHATSSYTEEICNSYLFKAIQPKCNAFRWMKRWRIKIWQFRSHNLKCVFSDSPEIETSLMMNHLAFGLFAQMNDLTALVGARVQTSIHTAYGV